MIDTFGLTLALATGVLLGGIFFGGLWWTIRMGVSSKQPALLFLGSLLLRTGIVVAGSYLIAAGRWQRFLACLAGFVAARVVVVRFTSTYSEQAIRHAP